MDCSICCEKFNKSTRLKVKCRYCEDDTIAVCRACAARYILESSTDPKCMVCKMTWDNEILAELFTKKFVSTEIKKHKENILVEKEQQYLPETQQYAANLKLIDSLNTELYNLFREKRKYDVILFRLKKNIRETNSHISDVRLNLNNNTEQNKNGKLFCYKCPCNNCKGFLDEKFKCGLCESKICKHCMEIVDNDIDSHICDEQKKESVKLIKRDSKPCPKCGELIFKISGCDQMWCTMNNCKTAFSWKTGEIEKGHIHNPEYYRWMRENNIIIPRDPQDYVYDPCGNHLPSLLILTKKLRDIYNPLLTGEGGRVSDQEIVKYLLQIHRIALHCESEERTQNRLLQSFNNQKKIYRANYLLSKLSKDDWKKKLINIQNTYDKNNKNYAIFNILKIVCYEYLGKMMELPNYTSWPLENIEIMNTNKACCENIRNDFSKIIKTCNYDFKKTGQLYNRVYPGIDSNLNYHQNYASYVKKYEK